MGTVAPEELARLWAQEAVTTERAVGQIVQQLVTIQAHLDRQAQALMQLRADFAALTAQPGNGPKDLKQVRRPK